MLTEYLAGEGIRTTAAFNGPDGVAAALSGQFDAVILDVMLPGIDGNEVLRRIRQSSRSIAGHHAHRQGRRCGPGGGAGNGRRRLCRQALFSARAGGAAARGAAAPARYRRPPPAHLAIGQLQLSPGKREVSWDGGAFELTTSEFDLLESLMRAGEMVSSKEELSLKVLGRPREIYDRSVDVHVSNLRKKLAGCQQRRRRDRNHSRRRLSAEGCRHEAAAVLENPDRLLAHLCADHPGHLAAVHAAAAGAGQSGRYARHGAHDRGGGDFGDPHGRPARRCRHSCKTWPQDQRRQIEVQPQAQPYDSRAALAQDVAAAPDGTRYRVFYICAARPRTCAASFRHSDGGADRLRVGGLGFSAILAWYLTQPIQRMQAGFGRLAQGDFTTAAGPGDGPAARRDRRPGA